MLLVDNPEGPEESLSPHTLKISPCGMARACLDHAVGIGYGGESHRLYVNLGGGE